MTFEQTDKVNQPGPTRHRRELRAPVAESAADLPSGSPTARSIGIRSRVGLCVPLLPILGIYTLIAVLVHTAANDEPAYLEYAKYLSHYFDAPAHWPYDFLWHGPVLPALLAPFVALHVPLEVTRILAGPVVLFAAVVTFYRLVRLYLRPKVALIATYGLAFYFPFFTTLGHIHVEPLATLLITLAAFFMVRSFRGSKRDHVWAAVALALLALSRTEYGYVLLLALVLSAIWWLASRRSPAARRSTLALAMALLLCTPYLAYTYSLTNRPFYWGDSGGLQLYWMTAPGNIGDWHRKAEAFTYPALAASRPVFANLDRMETDPRTKFPQLEQDIKLQQIAFANIKRDPEHYLSNVVFNIGRLLFNSPYSFENEHASGTSPGWGMMLYAVPNALLLGVLAIAAFVAVKVRRGLGPEIPALAVFIALCFAIHVPVAAYGRLLIPIVPTAAWLAIAVLVPHVRLSVIPRRRGSSVVVPAGVVS